MSYRATAESAKTGDGSNSATVQAQWKLPQEGLWKLNADTTVQEDSREWSVGVVIRDRHGGFRAAGVVSYHNDISVGEAEDQAVFGLQLAANLEIYSIEVETDC